jgi:hypothetical protein
MVGISVDGLKVAIEIANVVRPIMSVETDNLYSDGSSNEIRQSGTDGDRQQHPHDGQPWKLADGCSNCEHARNEPLEDVRDDACRSSVNP